MYQSDVSNEGVSAVMPGTERKSRDRDERRAEIMKAATELFARKGYDGTTMAEIAEATRQAVGTLYKFFKDKHDLYQALVTETVHDFERQLVAALESPGDPVDRLHRFIDVGSEMFVQHLPMTRVYFGQTAAAFLFASAGLADESYLSYQRIVGAVEKVMRDGVQAGKFIDLPPVVLALGLEGVHNGFLASLVRDPGSFTPAQIADYTKRMFFGSVLKR